MLEFTFDRNQNDQELAFFNGKALLSKRDPLAQINKFVQEQDLKSEDTIIVLAPPFNYIQTCLIKCNLNNFFLIYPEKNKIFGNQSTSNSDRLWTEGTTSRLDAFLESIINESNYRSLKIIEWLPLSSLYQNFRTKLLSLIKSLLNALQQNISTEHYFRRRWHTNILHNISFLKNLNKPVTSQGLCYLAASGPSLNANISALQAYRHELIVAALPSSLECLVHNKIVPDYIFSSDGGYYADIHLRNFLNKTKHSDSASIIIAPFRANLRPFYGTDYPICLITSGSDLESEILSTNRLKSWFPLLADRGTVAATAIDYLLSFHQGPILVSGLDLTNSDLKNHVEPHTYSYKYYFEQNRQKPSYSDDIADLYNSRVWFAGKNWRNPALQRYHEWFSAQVQSNSLYASRVYSSSDETEPSLSKQSIFKESSIEKLLITLNHMKPIIRLGEKIPESCFDSFLEMQNGKS